MLDEFSFTKCFSHLIPCITSIESLPNDSVVIISEFFTIQKHEKNLSKNDVAIFVLFVWLNNAALSTFRTALILVEHLILLALLVLFVKSPDTFFTTMTLVFVARFVYSEPTVTKTKFNINTHLKWEICK